jgi:hypothetical protein
MAEDAFYEIKQAFEILNSEEFGILTDDSSTKITIYSSHDFSRNNMAFRFGFLLYGLESEFFSRWFGGDPARLREWYQKDVKHETMHVIQFWLLGHDRYTHYEYGISWPEFWFSEGIAEYISGGSFTPIETMDQVNAWLQDPDHINPVSILRHDSSPVDDSRIGEYYPMFGLAVRYLLDENGLGRTFLDVKAMFSDMQNTESFRASFETFMGITVEYYEENFFDLIADFLNQTDSD